MTKIIVFGRKFLASRNGWIGKDKIAEVLKGVETHRILGVYYTNLEG